MDSIKSKLRSIIRTLFLSVAGSINKPAPYVCILNGHMVDWYHDNDKDGERFARLLAELHKYCDLVNFEDAVRMIVNQEKVERCTIAFSFDDGWRDCYTQIAPQLEKYGVNAMFFINPNFADAADNNDVAYMENFTVNTTKSPGKHPMTWAQIKDLQKRGFLFGAHTLDHYCINDNNIEELEHQIGDCRKVMEEKLGVPCEYFAFPYGRLEHANPASIDIACQYYKYVFSQSDHKHFFSYGGKVINRRHFEPFWPVSHVMYFLSTKRS
ncbi:polysaccharide deacetylase family protein [Parabacteroides distasonis]|nr:polysaccharide deacetylase family protein [Parabacteroides distasonis]